MISYWLLGKKLKVGDTVSDGWKTVVLGRDNKFHYVTSGNHAKYHVMKGSLDEYIK